MNQDAFSKRHPIVNFLFFLGAIGFGVMIQHPMYLLAGFFCSTTYYLQLNGSKGLKNLLWMLLGKLDRILIKYGMEERL